jgi:hypothetical protein
MSLTKRYYEQQAEQNAPAQKLEAARALLRIASSNVAATEGRLLDLTTADEINHALRSAARHLEELTITFACMERRIN